MRSLLSLSSDCSDSSESSVSSGSSTIYFLFIFLPLTRIFSSDMYVYSVSYFLCFFVCYFFLPLSSSGCSCFSFFKKVLLLTLGLKYSLSFSSSSSSVYIFFNGSDCVGLFLNILRGILPLFYFICVSFVY
jgi:hypothetical protein